MMSYIVNFKLDTKQHSWLWLISYSGSFVYFEWVNWAFFFIKIKICTHC